MTRRLGKEYIAQDAYYDEYDIFIGTLEHEEVVRCKDCQYYVDECCERYADETLGYVHSTQPDYFCAVAARKEDA